MLLLGYPYSESERKSTMQTMEMASSERDDGSVQGLPGAFKKHGERLAKDIFRKVGIASTWPMTNNSHSVNSVHDCEEAIRSEMAYARRCSTGHTWLRHRSFRARPTPPNIISLSLSLFAVTLPLTRYLILISTCMLNTSCT